MKRNLSLRSYATRAKEAAAELGQRVAAIEVRPDGSIRAEFAPVAAGTAAVQVLPDAPETAETRLASYLEGRSRAAPKVRLPRLVSR